LIAYIPTAPGQSENDVIDELHKWWPEATDIDGAPRDQITFTDRFPKPSWWRQDAGTILPQ
jgi:hypothetical protein